MNEELKEESESEDSLKHHHTSGAIQGKGAKSSTMFDRNSK